MEVPLLSCLARLPCGAVPLRAIASVASGKIPSCEYLPLHATARGHTDKGTAPSTSSRTTQLLLSTARTLSAQPRNQSLIELFMWRAGLAGQGTAAITFTATIASSSSRSSTNAWGSSFRSFATQATATEPKHPQQPEPQQPPRPPHDVVYFGPLSQQHKLLKRISITNTLVAAAAAPAIVAFADNISLVSRYGLAASLVLFGVATTGALHWVANPYVHELRYSAASGTVEVRTTTLMGSSRWHSFNLDEVQPLPWNRPVATFTARNRFYYIDVYSFPDEQLRRRLTPDEADVPKGYNDKEDDED